MPPLQFGKSRSINPFKFYQPASLSLAMGSKLHRRSSYRLSSAEFDELAHLSQQILLDHRGAFTLYLGIGRSPTPIIAYLKQQPGTYACSLPLSELTSPDHSTRDLSQCRADFIYYMMRILRPFAKRFCHLVLIDFCLSGKSLISASEFIGNFVQELQMPCTHSCAALAYSAAEPAWSHSTQEVRVYPLDPFPILQSSFFKEKYDFLAEFNNMRMAASSRSNWLFRDLCSQVLEQNSASLYLQCSTDRNGCLALPDF